MQTHEWENMLSDVEEKYWDYPIQTQLALTEAVRLRREVAAFRDQMIKSAERYKAMYDGGEDIELLLDADYDRQIAHVLNRILNGDTDD